MLYAALDASLIVALHLAALESKGALDPRHSAPAASTTPLPHVLFRRCPHHMNPLIVVDELVRKLAKEFEAACLLVVRMDHLLKKR